MFSAFFTGFFLGLSLIVAIGAQNVFVLRQGILRHHVFFLALFCSISDSLLIAVGVAGASYFFSDFIVEYSKIIFGIAGLWLSAYGLLRIHSAFKSNYAISNNNSKPNGLFKALSIVAFLTFANPHVYLDTMVLIGSISQQFIDFNRLLFAIGACLASFIWFFGIAYFAKFLAPIINKPFHWRIFDLIIAIIIFIISFNLISQGGWF